MIIFGFRQSAFGDVKGLTAQHLRRVDIHGWSNDLFCYQREYDPVVRLCPNPSKSETYYVDVTIMSDEVSKESTKSVHPQPSQISAC
jgi:hypothetical protein